MSPSQLVLLQQGEPEIDEVLEEDEEVVPYQYKITTVGSDPLVSTLVKQLNDGDIIIPAFQRGYVWSLREASRFIESLLFGLPVPNIFLSVEPETQKLLVVDGRQRLSTLQYFYSGIWPLTKLEFAIKGTGEKGKYEGLTYRTLPDPERRKLDNSVLRASTIKQDQPSEDDSSIYHVFERLNTSGVSLTPQEIRAAIYHGEFSDLIKELNQNKKWREIYGQENRLMRDQELILRFLAFYFDGEKYASPMKQFLNLFMARNRKLTRIPGKELSSTFTSSVETIYAAVGKRAFRPSRAINTAVFDSVMVGIAKRLKKGTISSVADLKNRYDALLADETYLEITQHSTGHPTNVKERLRLASEAFDAVT